MQVLGTATAAGRGRDGWLVGWPRQVCWTEAARLENVARRAHAPGTFFAPLLKSNRSGRKAGCRQVTVIGNDSYKIFTSGTGSTRGFRKELILGKTLVCQDCRSESFAVLRKRWLPASLALLGALLPLLLCLLGDGLGSCPSQSPVSLSFLGFGCESWQPIWKPVPNSLESFLHNGLVLKGGKSFQASIATPISSFWQNMHFRRPVVPRLGCAMSCVLN